MAYEEIIKRIRDEFGDDATTDAPMSERTTFHVGGPADLLVAPRTKERLQKLVRLLDGAGAPVFILGGGSNLIVRDGGIRGVVIDMSCGFGGMEFSEYPDGETHIRVGASVSVADLVEECAERGFSGLEWAAGIPGAVGGGIRGNAGTRDGDFSRVIVTVEIIDEKGDLWELPRYRLPFGYRRLGLPGRFVIVSGLLHLRVGDPEKIRKTVESMIEWRTRKQPYESACAGSIFKNPEHAPAGRLIDQAGMKGARVGDAMVSELHTNFIVNAGGARASDILELIERVKRRVFEVHGVALETEVVIAGEP